MCCQTNELMDFFVRDKKLIFLNELEQMSFSQAEVDYSVEHEYILLGNFQKAIFSKIRTTFNNCNSTSNNEYSTLSVYGVNSLQKA